jgi:trehalose-phosphatase
MIFTPVWLQEKLIYCERLALFLDYDGTLAEFVETPDIVEPNPKIIELIDRLSRHPRITITIISGRRLDQVQELLPVSGITIAGTYGIEIRMPDGKVVRCADYETIRSLIEPIKREWVKIVSVDKHFFVEDKLWAVAIHARNASDQFAKTVLERARSIANEKVDPTQLQIIEGDKFLEVAPKNANKAQSVDYLLNLSSVKNLLTIYMGDDSHDDEAMAIIHEHGGVAIQVGRSMILKNADWRLKIPLEARKWLAGVSSYVKDAQ